MKKNLDSFQGKLSSKKYFEGYYYKISQGIYTFSIIVGVSIGSDNHSFIQTLDSRGVSHYFRFPLEEFQYDKNILKIKIGSNIFTHEKVILNLTNESINISADIFFCDIFKYPKKMFHPGIMGLFTNMPLMECKHHIVHLSSVSNGFINIDGNLINVVNANSYVEKDYGKSFPASYTWVQGNTFKKNHSVFLSIATIPYLFFKFKGVISCLKIGNKVINISTYNGAKIIKNTEQEIVIKNKKYFLTLNISCNNSGKLIAPINGFMGKEILESNNATIRVILQDNKKNILFDEETTHCGVEIVN